MYRMPSETKNGHSSSISHDEQHNSMFPVMIQLCSSTGTTGPDGYIHARQDPHTEDLAHPNLQSSFVAEGSRIYCHGLVSGNYLFLWIYEMHLWIFHLSFSSHWNTVEAKTDSKM